MTRTGILLGALTVSLAATAGAAQAADGDWRLGRVYYRMVCTSCHSEQAGHSIAPSEKTKAEWTAYLAADKHDASGKSNPKLSHFASQAYRESIKDTNKAAAKFLKMPEGELMAAISAFVVYGAKDSDNPASCQ
jgi:cytochrome c5